MALVQCLFVGNYGGVKGGAVSICSDGTPMVLNCTFVENEAITGSGIYTEGEALIGNTIIAFCQGGAGFETLAPAHLNCTDIYGNPGGDWVGEIAHLLGVNGNLSEDPLFCNFSSSNFGLKPGSPCSPENNPECGLIGTGPVGCFPSTVPEGLGPADRLRLLSCAPNPFSHAARIDFSVDDAVSGDPVQLQVFDMRGRAVRTMVRRLPGPGASRFSWDGRTDAGSRAAQGAYVYRLTIGRESQAGRVLLVR